jgi:hypothetical protein
MSRKFMLLFVVSALAIFTAISVSAQDTGVVTTNGWYEGEEIYYILGGVEKGVTEKGPNQIYFIGDNRLYQANVVLHIPGEPGYTPHWNVNVVHTASGVTISDIRDAGLLSEHFDNEGVIFDDAEDILTAESMGLVTVDKLGFVVLCPIIPEAAADAPGNTPLPEDFLPVDATF